MRLTVDWLNPVRAANARLLQCVAPLGASSRVRRTARSTRSSPICRGAPGRSSSPKAATPPVIKRFRHIPTVKPVVCSLAATTALFCPRAHSRMTRGRKTKDRGSRTPRLLQQTSQRHLLLWIHNEFSLLRTSSWIGHDPRSTSTSTYASYL